MKNFNVNILKANFYFAKCSMHSYNAKVLINEVEELQSKRLNKK